MHDLTTRTLPCRKQSVMIMRSIALRVCVV